MGEHGKFSGLDVQAVFDPTLADEVLAAWVGRMVFVAHADRGLVMAQALEQLERFGDAYAKAGVSPRPATLLLGLARSWEPRVGVEIDRAVSHCDASLALGAALSHEQGRTMPILRDALAVPEQYRVQHVRWLKANLNATDLSPLALFDSGVSVEQVGRLFCQPVSPSTLADTAGAATHAKWCIEWWLRVERAHMSGAL